MSILAGLDSIFDQHLGVEPIGKSSPHYWHRTSAYRLSAGRPVGFQALPMLQEAYSRLLSNLNSSAYFLFHGASKENWRFEKQLGIAPEKPSSEAGLERAIVRAMGERWANQMPTASGLWNDVADKRRAVDLVFAVGEKSFELIELKVKVKSDTPLRAAVEIVQYGLLYALARECDPEEQQTEKALLRAKDVRLRVLAPTSYYTPYELSWLEHDLDVGLRNFSLKRFDMPLLTAFSFQAFPNDFCWPCPEDVLCEHVRQRSRMWIGQPPL